MHAAGPLKFSKLGESMDVRRVTEGIGCPGRVPAPFYAVHPEKFAMGLCGPLIRTISSRVPGLRVVGTCLATVTRDEAKNRLASTMAFD